MLALLLPLLLPAQVEPFSLRIGESARSGPLLHLLPAAPAIESVIEQLYPAAITLIEESGGFSRIDPQKLSIYGDSWTWNHWLLDDLDLTDPFFSGAAALHVPHPFLDDLAVEYNESPANLHGDGVHLHSSLDGAPELRAFARYTFADAGGDVSFGERGPPVAPDGARRRLVAPSFDLGLADLRDLGAFRLRSAVELIRGTRRFNQFEPVSGAFAGTFDEPFLIASAAARLEPRSKAWSATLLAEYRQRDHLFDELYFAKQETARLQTETLVLGFTTPGLTIGATLKAYQLDAVEQGFTRELLDPDGEGTHPWYPSGSYVAGTLDATWQSSLLYSTARLGVVGFTPSTRSWSNPLTFRGDPYGRIDWSSAPTVEAFGDHRLGIRDVQKTGDLTVSYNLYGSATYGANSSGSNTLAFADLGFATEVAYDLTGWLTSFVNLARTPIPISPELVRFLDLSWLSGRQYLGASTLLDTTGGGSIRTAPGLSGTTVSTFALGSRFRFELGPRWALTAQVMVKRYQDTYWVGFDGPPDAYGQTAGGVFYLNPGEKRYLLRNYRLGTADQPVFAGAQLGLALVSQRPFLFNIGVTAFNTVGVPPLGNGPTSNDLGLADYTTANPNALIHGWSDFGGDRGFSVKALAGWEVIDRVWALVSFRFYDGEPFAFFDYSQHDGQVAIAAASRRASPYKVPPLEGPRKEYHQNVDLSIRYQGEIAGQGFTAAVVASNLLDLGHQLAEGFSDAARATRQSLELQVPRAIIASLEAAL